MPIKPLPPEVIKSIHKECPLLLLFMDTGIKFDGFEEEGIRRGKEEEYREIVISMEKANKGKGWRA